MSEFASSITPIATIQSYDDLLASGPPAGESQMVPPRERNDTFSAGPAHSAPLSWAYFHCTPDETGALLTVA